MVGSGWDRLVGFDVSSDTLSTTKFGKSPYDLSQSCVVNIYLDGLQNCMSAA